VYKHHLYYVRLGFSWQWRFSLSWLESLFRGSSSNKQTYTLCDIFGNKCKNCDVLPGKLWYSWSWLKSKLSTKCHSSHSIPSFDSVFY